MKYYKKFLGHLKTVIKHKYWVGYYCFKAGLYWQGVTHDLSKFNPVEFFESVRYWQGHRSPIDACKEDKGCSMAWLHHKGRNKHHYEYWCDNFDRGFTCHTMPYKYAAEMFCDFMGAGRAYMGDKFTYEAEYNWWQKKKKVGKFNPKVRDFIDACFEWTMENMEPIDGMMMRYLYDKCVKD